MNKSLSILFCFCSVCLFFLSCGRADYDDEIGAAYWEAEAKINDGTTDTDPAADPTNEPTEEPTSEPTAEPKEDPTDSTDTALVNCGNRTIDAGEVCDGNATECNTIYSGYTGGVATCNADCLGWNVSDCLGTPVNPDPTEPTNNTNPCDPNPCAGVANSTGGCIQKSTTDYSCECANNYDWNAGSKKCEAKIAECSPINGLMWSSKQEEKDFYEAQDYCAALVTCGENGWHLPTISELRTLIKDCAKTETGGSCKVTDSCVSSQCDSDNCYLPRCGSSSHSIFGDTNSLWSSSYKLEDDVATTAALAWKINFTDASINSANTGTTYNFRCVRKAN